jgi:hypothetical protein
MAPGLGFRRPGTGNMPAGLANLNAASNANGGTAAAGSLGLTVTQGSQCPGTPESCGLPVQGSRGAPSSCARAAEKWLYSYY